MLSDLFDLVTISPRDVVLMVIGAGVVTAGFLIGLVLRSLWRAMLDAMGATARHFAETADSQWWFEQHHSHPCADGGVTHRWQRTTEGGWKCKECGLETAREEVAV